MMKKISAWLPIVMSVAAISLVLGYVLVGGVSEVSDDEGVAARVFQLLIVGQLPVFIYFGVKHWSQDKLIVMKVLGAQLTLVVAAVALVKWFEM